MSSKKKKSAKSDDAGVDGGSGVVRVTSESQIELLEMKLKEATEKSSRYKEKFDQLMVENGRLGEIQARMSIDKQDIVEFLSIKVNEHERNICDLEEKLKQAEEDKESIRTQARGDVEKEHTQAQEEIFNLQLQYSKYKSELDNLSEFRGRKDETESMVVELKQLLEQREREYKNNIHDLERKVLQDKNQMKKEMLHKVNEAVANFRRVADQQMAETTKRSIRENMAISSQLKKMSTKSIELLQQNDSLTKKVVKIRIANSLLVQSEQDLAKKNQANQRVIKVLVDKLKEGDKMLEMAYDLYQLQEHATLDVVDETIQENEEDENEDEEYEREHGTNRQSVMAQVKSAQELDSLQSKATECACFLDELIDFLWTNYGINPNVSEMASQQDKDQLEVTDNAVEVADKDKFKMLMTRAVQLKSIIDDDREPSDDNNVFGTDLTQEQPEKSEPQIKEPPENTPSSLLLNIAQQQRVAALAHQRTEQLHVPAATANRRQKRLNEISISDVVRHIRSTSEGYQEVSLDTREPENRNVATQTRVANGGVTPEMVLSNEVRAWGPTTYKKGLNITSASQARKIALK